MSETMTVERPGVVTFVGIVLYIKAVIAAVVGISLIIERNNSTLLEITGREADFITTTAITELIVAVLLFFVASAVMNGAKWGRLAVAIVVGVRLAVAAYWMIAHIGHSGLGWNAIINVGLGIFVLWALYGNDRSQAYYEGYA